MNLNLFSSLAKYAYRQEENFLTEALVYVFNLIVDMEGKKSKSILVGLCGSNTGGWFDNIKETIISTQFTVDEGRPDIVITVGEDRVVFIEVKHDSSLGQDQLERYYDHLEKSPYQEKQLVLLTRSKHSVQETSLDQEIFHHVCWYQIAGWLSETEFEDETVNYIVQQFLDFLEEKEMNMEKVTWEFIEGIPAMKNLLNMMGTAIAEANPDLGVKKTIGWSWGGYYLDGSIFLGFRFSNHLIISFEDDTGNNPTFKRDLDLEQAHFFSLSSGEQLECLIDFIKTSYTEFEA